MSQEKHLSIADITRELNSGPATIKFILKRFNPWLPFDRIGGQHQYSRNTIPILIKIKESLEAGMLPSEIDQELETSSLANSDTTIDSASDRMEEIHFQKMDNEDIRVSRDGLDLIKSLFDDMAIQQNRVACAHEKRAEAEERKAAAIEKRAEAEEKKALAMNNIAAALKEMSHHRASDSQAGQAAIQAAQVLTIDESAMDESAIDDSIDDFIGETNGEFGDDSNAEIELPHHSEIGQQDDNNLPDSLFDLLETTDIEMDDLSSLIDNEEVLMDNEEMLGIDDLAKLLDDPMSHPDMIDDLSVLIDTVSTDTTSTNTVSIRDVAETQEMDNLSLLIEQPKENQQTALQMDDLSLLIEPSAANAKEAVDKVPLESDDLSLLIEPDTAAPDSAVGPMAAADPLDSMDNLTALIDEPPSLKPAVTPKENLKEYKAAVMKIIIALKKEGLSAEESTGRLNHDNVQTISGKPRWSEKAISQIYKFIDSAS